MISRPSRGAALLGLWAGLLLPCAGAARALPVPGSRRDVVIVGGGLAGLTAAHFLRDRDILVLEKEPRAGGKARGEKWGSLGYSVAATYFSQPYGSIRKILEELDIQAAPIPHPQDGLAVGGARVPDFLDGGIALLPHPAAELEGLRKMASDMRRYAEGPIVAMPPTPGPEAMTPEMRGLDAMTFQEFLEKSYGTRAALYGDMISRGIFGSGAADVSALQGVNALGAQYGPTASFEGGLGAIAQAVSRELGPRLLTGARVERVTQEEDGVSISYLRAGRRETVRARAAVLAVDAPALLTIVDDLPEPRRRDLEAVRYSAYALVVLALKEPLPMATMSLWSLGTFFTDISLPGIAQTARPAGPGEPAQLILAAVPLGAGRQGALDAMSDRLIVKNIVKDAVKIFPDLPHKLLGSRVIRWRHAMPVVGPGYLTGPRARLARPEGRLFFAGQETEMPYSEGAIVSGERAALEARASLK